MMEPSEPDSVGQGNRPYALHRLSCVHDRVQV